MVILAFSQNWKTLHLKACETTNAFWKEIGFHSILCEQTNLIGTQTKCKAYRPIIYCRNSSLQNCNNWKMKRHIHKQHGQLRRFRAFSDILYIVRKFLKSCRSKTTGVNRWFDWRDLEQCVKNLSRWYMQALHIFFRFFALKASLTIEDRNTWCGILMFEISENFSTNHLDVWIAMLVRLCGIVWGIIKLFGDSTRPSKKFREVNKRIKVFQILSSCTPKWVSQ